MLKNWGRFFNGKMAADHNKKLMVKNNYKRIRQEKTGKKEKNKKENKKGGKK